MAAHPQQKLVLVTHGGVLDMVYRTARALGLDTAGGPSDTSPFTVLTRTGDTLVIGADDKHLDFRGVLRIVGDDGTVQLRDLDSPEQDNISLALVKIR